VTTIRITPAEATISCLRTRYELTSLLTRVYLGFKTPTKQPNQFSDTGRRSSTSFSFIYASGSYVLHTTHRSTFEFSTKLINCRLNYRSKLLPKLLDAIPVRGPDTRPDRGESREFHQEWKKQGGAARRSALIANEIANLSRYRLR